MTETLHAETTTIETYYEILRSGAERFDPERLKAVLSPDLVFEGPIAGHRIGAEPFRKGVAGFVTALRHLDMLQLVTAPGQAAACYDAELPGGTCRFAEFFELDAGGSPRSGSSSTRSAISKPAAADRHSTFGHAARRWRYLIRASQL